MSKYWSPIVGSLTPYVPGEQPKVDGLVKLNTNENPYPPSPKVIAAMQAELNDNLRRYPDPDSSRLKQAITDCYGLAATDNVFVGNGSDEVLAHIFCGLLDQGQPILFPDISYSFYPVYCKLYDIAFRAVFLDDALQLNVEDYRQPNGGIIFANPNAPTGRALPLADIETMLQANPDVVVVVDEAYIDFGGDSAVRLISRYPNLLVVQTLSKARSLAGLRVGYAMGQPGLIEGLERIKNSFNSYPLDRIAVAGAVAALEDRAYFDETRQKVIASREQLSAELGGMGFEVLPSAANFLFATHPQHDAAGLVAALREKKVLVRYFNAPRIDQYLRITVGADPENQALLTALKDILADG